MELNCCSRRDASLWSIFDNAHRRGDISMPSQQALVPAGSLSILNFAQPPFEKPALTAVSDQLKRSRVALCRLRRGSGAAQQIGACSMQQMIAAQLAAGGERIDDRERRLRALHHS